MPADAGGQAAATGRNRCAVNMTGGDLGFDLRIFCLSSRRFCYAQSFQKGMAVCPISNIFGGSAWHRKRGRSCQCCQ
jgi:hypothetical protein